MIQLLDGELDLVGMASQMEQLGFPVLAPSEIPPCGNSNPCSRERALIDISTLTDSFG